MNIDWQHFTPGLSLIGAACVTLRCSPKRSSGTARIAPPAPVSASTRPTSRPRRGVAHATALALRGGDRLRGGDHLCGRRGRAGVQNCA